MGVVVEVYRISKRFPKHEQYGLTQQMRRAAISVTSNIAEGQSRRSKREFIRFIIIALGSPAELESQLLVAKRLALLDSASTTPVLVLIGQTGRLLRGLERSLVAHSAKELPH